MEYNIQVGRNCKSHDWDFTLPATRENVWGADYPQACKATHTQIYHGIVIAKAIGKRIVQSLCQIARRP